MTRRIREFGKELDEAFAFQPDRPIPEGSRVKGLIQDAISFAMENSFGEEGRDGRELRSRFGLEFSFSEPSRGVFDLDLEALSAGIQKDPRLLIDFLTKEGSTPEGLIPTLTQALKEVEKLLVDKLDSTGSLVDLVI